MFCVLLCVTLCPFWFILFGKEELVAFGKVVFMCLVPRGCCEYIPFTLSIYDLKFRLHFQVDNYSNCLIYCDYVLFVIYFIKRDKLFDHQHYPSANAQHLLTLTILG